MSTDEFAAEMTRRRLLQAGTMGLGSIALNWMLAGEAQAELHHRPRAKSIIWCFMEGGPSHLDLVDPKPLLNQLAGKPLPSSFREPITAMGERVHRSWHRHANGRVTAKAVCLPRTGYRISVLAWMTSRSSVLAGPTASITQVVFAR